MQILAIIGALFIIASVLVVLMAVSAKDRSNEPKSTCKTHPNLRGHIAMPSCR